MKNIKHVGRIKNTGAKVLVAFRTLPGESNMCLIVPTESLPDRYHDSIMELVETDFAQESFEFGEALFTKYFPDGRIMLAALQQDGRLVKSPTDNVVMTPTPTSQIPLSDLNTLIAEQKNCAIDDLCTFVKGAPKDEEKETVSAKSEPKTESVQPLQANTNSVLSDKDIAKNYRSQADAMYKEAARLRKEADDLDPPVKKSTSKAKLETSA
jgi:hypothetical protein